MIVSEVGFKHQIERLGEAFTPKAFNPSRVKLIRQWVDELTDQEFARICDHFIASFKSAPLPVDFKEAAKKELRAHPRPRSQFQAPYVIQCPECNDVGVVRMLQGDISVLGLCDCAQGRDQVWKLPVAKNVTGYRNQPVPPESFLPSLGRVKDAKTNEEARRLEANIMNWAEGKIQWWREKVRISEEYWKHNVGDL